MASRIQRTGQKITQWKSIIKSFRYSWSLEFKMIYYQRKRKFTCALICYGQHLVVRLNSNENSAASYQPKEWLENAGEAVVYHDRISGRVIKIELFSGSKFYVLFDSELTTDGVDQWGTMCGTYQDNSLDDLEKELYLRGLRQRRWGQSNNHTLHR